MVVHRKDQKALALLCLSSGPLQNPTKSSDIYFDVSQVTELCEQGKLCAVMVHLFPFTIVFSGV